MSDLEIIGQFRVDEVVEVPTSIKPNPDATNVRIVLVNIDHPGRTIVIDTKIPEDLLDDETVRDFHARGQVPTYAGPGTYQWEELIVTDKNGNEYNEWGDEIAVDDPRINRAVRILPADADVE